MVIYRGGPLLAKLSKVFLTCKYISLPNLIADRLVLPEFFYSGSDASPVAAIGRMLDGWLSDPAVLATKRREMADLLAEIGTTGATPKAADAILSRLGIEPAASARRREPPFEIDSGPHPSGSDRRDNRGMPCRRNHERHETDEIKRTTGGTEHFPINRFR